VELGEWESFYNKYFWEHKETHQLRNTQFTKWLLSKEEGGVFRLCKLVAEYIKEKEQ